MDSRTLLLVGAAIAALVIYSRRARAQAPKVEIVIGEPYDVHYRDPVTGVEVEIP